MSALPVALAALVALWLGYRIYSRFLSDTLFGLDASETVPAHQHADGIDFVPTHRSTLWGHHFSSIAGAAPILGPAIAIVWGWLPALVWIVFGVIFMGAAHDFGALVLSMRHEGQSVGRLAERFIGPRSRTLFLVIIFFLIWMVGAVFAFAIASLFVKFPASILPVNLEILVAVCLGYYAFKRGGSLMLPSIIILMGLYLVIFGTATGTLPSPGEDSLLRDLDFWLIALMIYAFVASSLPVWLLLQPRDLINSHQLIVGLVAMYLGFALTAPTFNAPTVGPLDDLPTIIPLLFVTIACGAISGFHGLVSSGTTSKQISCAKDARSIGYGAMLCEASLAILATMAVASGQWIGAEHTHAFEFLVSKTDGGHSLPSVPTALAAFINGAASFLGSLGLPAHVGVILVAVLVISFAATSLDTALRIQRLVLAEIGTIYRIKPLTNRWVGGGIAALSVLALIYVDKANGAKSLWPVFGATNQVLAAFTLLMCALYLRTLGRRSTAYAIPAVFVMTITMVAMALQITRDLSAGHYMVGGVGLIIGIVTIWIAIEGALAWRRTRPNAAPSQRL